MIFVSGEYGCRPDTGNKAAPRPAPRTGRGAPRLSKEDVVGTSFLRASGMTYNDDVRVMQVERDIGRSVSNLPLKREGAGMLLLLAALTATGVTILPQGITSAALLRGADDPLRLSELRLPTVASEPRIANEIDEALKQGDVDLARSFLDLAETQNVQVDADRRQQVEASATTVEAGAGANLLDGFTSGASDTWAGAVGSIASDLVGVSDLRDLWQEGNKLYRGQPYDGFVLGLATAGIALTGATVATLLPSGGASVAAKAPVARGLSLLKASRKAGLLSRELAEKLVRLTAGAIDTASLKEAAAAARALDLTAARQAARGAIRPGALRTVAGIGEDAVALEARIGQRGAAQALNVARDAGELTRARRLAEGMGRRTRATLKLLGTAALVLGNVVGVLLQAVWLAVVWAFTMAVSTRQIGLRIGRVIWGYPRRTLG